MSDEVEGMIPDSKSGHRTTKVESGPSRTPGLERPVQISVLKRGPVSAEKGKIERPAKVISIIERLEHRSMAESRPTQLPHPGAIKQGFRMTAGHMAYLKFRRQQREIRLRKLRRDVLKFVLSFLLILSSGYITYQVTSAWFTNRSVNLGTIIGDNAARKVHKVETRVLHRHKVIKSEGKSVGSNGHMTPPNASADEHR